jgi:hypothetical protein
MVKMSPKLAQVVEASFLLAAFTVAVGAAFWFAANLP